jgi:predicted site-specific integrase-resolvase
MKKSKPTKSNEQYKILRMLSRDEQFERNGGGQFVAVNRAFKNKVKYNRKDKKKELRNDLNSFLLSFYGKPYANRENQIKMSNHC